VTKRLQKRTCQLQNFAKEEELYIFVNRNCMSSVHDHFCKYKNNNEKRKKKKIKEKKDKKKMKGKKEKTRKKRIGA
jgi:hypothetical protein